VEYNLAVHIIEIIICIGVCYLCVDHFQVEDNLVVVVELAVQELVVLRNQVAILEAVVQGQAVHVLAVRGRHLPVADHLLEVIVNKDIEVFTLTQHSLCAR
jgi:hypothetical protein